MNSNKLDLFRGKGPYLLGPDGAPDATVPVLGVGEARAMGNRGGGNEEGHGMPGFVEVGQGQIAWAAEWMTGFLGWQPAERFVGHVFLHQVTHLAWHEGTILRFTYRGSEEGLFLAEFADAASMLGVRNALEAQGQGK